MRIARLAGPTDFEGWRKTARALRLAGVTPGEVVWAAGGEGELFADGDPAPAADAPAFTAPRAFVDLAQEVICHRDPERFNLLYRLLWRLQDQPALIQDITDPDVARAREMAKPVARASHKMKAFVRFRLLPGVEPETYAAWFEPMHHVVEKTAPFFVRRFAGMRFSILTPEACAHWDGDTLRFTPGVSRDAAPADDLLEDFWRTYYASIFNPARLKVKAMQAEMPKKYWRNLPEARLIPDLIASAAGRTAAMVAQAPTEPSRHAAKATKPVRDVVLEGTPPSLEALVAGVDGCRRCPLWKDATQGVPGEGSATARLMFVGEQPGDQEDLAGRPFVGPAGQVFDKALAEAGVPREQTYVTNAVKHFKHELRGKKRLHKTPVQSEISACRWWVDHERRLIRPRVIVALGATAALSVFGKATPIAANRGRAIQLPDQAQGVVTYHPSFLLRVPDAEAKEQGFKALVEDLALAWKLAA
ncbi:UdgX family uracil-DNA binding protein [Caulobacter sp. SLTY]|uniref:UdgX family uracil-DNA binding protein n=1 Tax=Caulobacter sp. SLTY TaxID=2683262 RepID=UPI0014136E62|nr:UdgX family uracil-DNA binding protein [Caulobacter sp. SLTY]NBB16795.1 UdgX family uracil-DNA binding protein [Caulobacter sp. SLTY]